MCSCHKIFGYNKDKVIYIHLMGCEESEESKAYDKLHWFKKLFTKNPRSYLNYYSGC